MRETEYVRFPKYVTQLVLSPEAAFHGLVGQPRWVFASILSGFIALLQSFLIIHHIGLQQLLATIIGVKGSIDPQAMLQNGMQHQTSILVSEVLSSFFGPFGSVLIATSVVTLILASLYGKVSFRFIAATIAHVILYVDLFRFLIIISVLYSGSTASFHVINPIGTNIGFYVLTGTASLNALLTHLDIATLLGLILCIWSLGHGLPKISLLGRTGAVMIAWGFYLGTVCLFA